ncbi:hypothetical protein BDW71DRAFT_198799 [Aspergillus fruticulosus]
MSILSNLFLIALVAYVVYLRHFHPLSQSSGPLFASLSNNYKAYYVYKLTIHKRLLGLHNTHGPTVRVGPNHLHTWEGDAIAPLYKGARSMGKSEFYDESTTFRPNLFGGRDEDVYSRRQLSHGFAQESVQKLEPLIEGQLAILISKLQHYAKIGQALDLKHTLNLYVLDILGDVAIAKPFDVQHTEDDGKLHAINGHLLLAGVIGELPCQSFTKLSRISPVPWMRRLMKSRNKLKGICAGCVQFKIQNLKTTKSRPDSLRSLVEATDPETGKRLVAGSHSTAGTLTLLLWHLVQNPSIMRKVQADIESTFGPLNKGQVSYPVSGLESSLKYTMACVRENFRLDLVFTRSYNKEKGRYLIPFSVGHRMCIGRNLAMTNILKIEPLETRDDVRVVSPGIGEMEGVFEVRVRV